MWILWFIAFALQVLLCLHFIKNLPPFVFNKLVNVRMMGLAVYLLWEPEVVQAWF